LTKLIGDPELQRAMPDWIRWIVTARSEPALNFQLQGHPIQIDLDKVDNQKADFRTYYMRRLADLTKKEDKILDILVDKAEESFLYCQLMSDEILKDPNKLKDPNTIPIGMNGYLAKFFETQFPQGFDEQTEQILSLMVAAIEPLEEELIQKITSMNKSKMAKWKRKVGSLIRCEGQKYKILKFYHSIVREWLIDEVENSDPGIYEIEPEEGHQLLADYGWGLFEEEEDWEDPEPLEYELQYLGVHLYASGKKTSKKNEVKKKLMQLFIKFFEEKPSERKITTNDFFGHHYKEWEPLESIITMPLKRIITNLFDYVVENYRIEEEKVLTKVIKKFFEEQNMVLQYNLCSYMRIYSYNLI